MGTETVYHVLGYQQYKEVPQVKLNNPLMGTETIPSPSGKSSPI